MLLLFDADGAYLLYADNSVDKISSSIMNEEREFLANYTGELSLDYTALEANCYLNLDNGGSARSLNAQKYLSVPSVQQASGTYSCWAASIKSICGYYGISKTIDQIYNTGGVTKYDGAGSGIAIAVMNSYGLTTSRAYDSNSFDWDMLTYFIDYDMPIYAGAAYDETEYDPRGHAIVISGYYEYDRVDQIGIISYMDPFTGDTAANTVATDKMFYYVDPGTPNQYRIQSFIGVEE